MHDFVTFMDRAIRYDANDGIHTVMNTTDVRRGQYVHPNDMLREYAGKDPTKWRMTRHNGYKSFELRPWKEQLELRELFRTTAARAKAAVTPNATDEARDRARSAAAQLVRVL